MDGIINQKIAEIDATLTEILDAANNARVYPRVTALIELLTKLRALARRISSDILRTQKLSRVDPATGTRALLLESRLDGVVLAGVNDDGINLSGRLKQFPFVEPFSSSEVNAQISQTLLKDELFPWTVELVRQELTRITNQELLQMAGDL